jgi:hypothetical protein
MEKYFVRIFHDNNGYIREMNGRESVAIVRISHIETGYYLEPLNGVSEEKFIETCEWLVNVDKKNPSEMNKDLKKLKGIQVSY